MTTVSARADEGLYCWEAVEAYENHRCRFVLVARKTSRLVKQLRAANWKRSLRTDADEHSDCDACIIFYAPQTTDMEQLTRTTEGGWQTSKTESDGSRRQEHRAASRLQFLRRMDRCMHLS